MSSYIPRNHPRFIVGELCYWNKSRVSAELSRKPSYLQRVVSTEYIYNMDESHAFLTRSPSTLFSSKKRNVCMVPVPFKLRSCSRSFSQWKFLGRFLMPGRVWRNWETFQRSHFLAALSCVFNKWINKHGFLAQLRVNVMEAKITFHPISQGWWQ